MFFLGKSNKKVEDPIQNSGLQHDFEAADHVTRWSQIIIYPIQIHGIVLSAGAGLVTIIDFGYSSGNQTVENIEGFEHEGRDRRLNIITLTEQVEVDKWKKVDYGRPLLSRGKWAKIVSWFQRKEHEAEGSEITGADSEKKENANEGGEDLKSEASETVVEDISNSSVPPPELFEQQRKEAELLMSLLDEEDEESDDENDVTGRQPEITALIDDTELETEKTDEIKLSKVFERKDAPNKAATKPMTAPSFPKSDPPTIVLARVRFLLSDEGRAVLPPHNLLFSNSECIALWAKTGRFSTMQSQIFLHSTALGNAKSATTVALIVGAQTVTVSSTVPAAGFWGWFGYTTTTTSQVGLLSVSPWLIPVLAGYGIAAVGTPYLILAQGARRWEKATSELNDAFWQGACGDVYLDAIRHWSGLGNE